MLVVWNEDFAFIVTANLSELAITSCLYNGELDIVRSFKIATHPFPAKSKRKELIPSFSNATAKLTIVFSSCW